MSRILLKGSPADRLPLCREATLSKPNCNADGPINACTPHASGFLGRSQDAAADMIAVTLPTGTYVHTRFVYGLSKSKGRPIQGHAIRKRRLQVLDLVIATARGPWLRKQRYPQANRHGPRTGSDAGGL